MHRLGTAALVLWLEGRRLEMEAGVRAYSLKGLLTVAAQHRILTGFPLALHHGHIRLSRSMVTGRLSDGNSLALPPKRH